MGDNAPPPYPGEKGGNPQYPPPGQGYAPPPQPYQPGAPGQYMPSPPSGQQQQATTVVVNQPAYTVIQHFRETPVRIKSQYNPPPGQQATTVVVTQPAYAVVQHFRETPVRLKCQYCQADVVTATFYETGTLTWVACFIIAIVGLWLGCCLIPFCLNACKDVVHKCPNCHQQLGRYNRM